MKTIAITGAAGLVGTGLRRELLQRSYALQLLDVKPIDPCYANEQSSVVDITDQTSLTTALRGCDAVVHLAACTTDAPWPEHVKLSIEGSISLFDAAREAGVTRVVYASSHHVVGLHRARRMGHVWARPYRCGPTAVTLWAGLRGVHRRDVRGQYGMQVLATRIGNVNTRPIDRRRMGNWLRLARPGATGGAGH
ncbi:MAG: NAD(P)-dependent oxidoreductase [Rhodoferax sp.]|nr:NAD(P)-dependent oxidoreductase [Rhodoferax sp.]